jgi:WD40 repeat protein
VYALAYLPDSYILAIACADGTIRLWNTEQEMQTMILEGHADAITSVSFSFDGQFFASKSLDNSIRIWRCETWETIAILPASTSHQLASGLAFNPKFSSLATTGDKDTVIHIWDLDFTALSVANPITSSVHYANAKVVLVGDTGVGKSGIG